VKNWKKKIDILIGRKIKKKFNRKELIEKLKEVNVKATGKASVIRTLAEQWNIPIEIEIDEKVEGWYGKPKEIL